MGNNFLSIIAATDITASSKPFARYRGKTAKEIYRFAKDIAVTKTFTGPILYTLAKVPAELSKGVIYSTIGYVGESAVAYVSGIGCARWIYKATILH